MASLFSLLTFFIFFITIIILNLTSIQVLAEILFEDGYTVSTVLDGNKLDIYPYSVLPQPGSSDLIILDSHGSTVYTASFPTSQGSVIKRFAGNGRQGYSDGDLASAMFNKPKNFAVDLKGNVYVADKNNNLSIRKISNSGVTTIAGGFSDTEGRRDGPGRNATFSNEFELAFIPERCALMISDHGTRLVRQINLKAVDCARGSQSVLGMASLWALGLAISCLVGLIIGFVIRPYVMPHVSVSCIFVIFCNTTGLLTHFLKKLCRQEGSNPRHFSETWKHCLISLGRHVLMLYFDIKSVVVSATVYALLRRLIVLSLSHLSLMFKLNIVESQPSCKKTVVSLLDSDDLSSSEISKLQTLGDQLKDLLSLDEGLEFSGSTNKILEQGDDKTARTDVLSDSHGKINDMIQANIMGFSEQAKKASLVEPRGSSYGLVKRR